MYLRKVQSGRPSSIHDVLSFFILETTKVLAECGFAATMGTSSFEDAKVILSRTIVAMKPARRKRARRMEILPKPNRAMMLVLDSPMLVVMGVFGCGRYGYRIAIEL